MKNFRKFISGMLVCVMLIGLLPVNVTAAEVTTIENVTEAATEAVIQDEVSSTDMAEPDLTADESLTEGELVETESTDVEEIVQEPENAGATDAEAEPTVGGTATVAVEEVVDSMKEVYVYYASAPIALEEGIRPLSGDHDLTIDECTLSINGEEYSETNKTVKDGDSVSILLEWSLPNDDTSIELEDLCIYSLGLEGIELTNVTREHPGNVISGGAIVGRYYIEGDTLYMYFEGPDGQDFLNGSNRGGTLELSGTVELADVELDQDGNGSITVGGEDFDIHVDKSNRPVEVAVDKSVSNDLEYDEEVGLVKRKFTIEVTAISDTDVIISDSSSDGNILIDMDSFEVEPAGALDYDFDDYGTYGNNDTEFAGSFSGTAHMEEGETITITYWAYAKKDIYAGSFEGKPWGVSDTNEVQVKDKNENTDSANAPFEVNPPYVEKTGDYESDDGIVTWTVTINNPDGIDLYESVVKDELQNPDDYDIEDADEYYVTITPWPDGEEWISVEDFLNNGYTFPEGSTEKKYIFTFTVKVSDSAKNSYDSTKTVKNKAKIVNEEYDIANTGTGEVGVGIENPLTDKTGELQEDVTTILWKSSLEITEESLSNVVYQDWFDDTMTLDESSIQISGLTKGTDYTVTAGPNKAGFATGFSIAFIKPLLKGSYEITYETTINPDATATTFWNHANLKIGDVETDEVNDNVTKKKMISKTGNPEWVSDGNSDILTWTVTIPEDAIPDMEGNYTIKDTLPAGTAYVEESGKANFSGLKIDSSEQGVVIFDVTDVVKAAQSERWGSDWMPDINIEYKTRITDMDTFLAADWESRAEYTNKAELLHDDKPVDRTEYTVTAVPGTIMEKDVFYSELTAPEARYTVDVNPNAFKLAGGNPVQIVDTLPANFDLNLNSVTLTDGITGEVITPPEEPIYIGNTLTVYVPDETYVILTYSVIVQKAVGSELNDENSTNAVRAAGVPKSEAKVALSSKSKLVLKGNATAGSETGKLTIRKVETGTSKTLQGAKFEIRMMKIENGTLVPCVQEDAPGAQLVQEFTTSEDGTFTVNNLLYDIVYEVKEKEAPSGYLTDGTPRYYAYPSRTQESDYEELDQEIVFCYAPKMATIENEKEEITTEEVTTEEVTTEEVTTEEVTTEEVTTEQFASEEVTSEEITTEETTTTVITETTTEETTITEAKTGDSSPIVPIVIVLLVSAAAVGVIIGVKRKNKE